MGDSEGASCISKTGIVREQQRVRRGEEGEGRKKENYTGREDPVSRNQTLET